MESDPERGIQRGWPVKVTHNERPAGLSDDLYDRALRVVDDWEDHADRTQTDLVFELYRLFSHG